MNLAADLFLSFAKIGCFTFGGGYAMIALIENLCVDKKKWMTHEEIMDVIVIAESTPGPIAINCATYAGYRQYGMKGAVCATAGMVLPSFLIILFLSYFLDFFLEIPWISNAFAGIRIAVGILILDAGINMVKKMKKKRFPIVVVSASCVLVLAGNLLSVRISSIALLLASAAVSLVILSGKRVQGRKERL